MSKQMSMKVDEVMAVVRTLTTEEQNRIRALLESLAAPEPMMTEDEFERELIAEGVLIDRNDFRFTLPAADRRDFKPVPITGKPVSEIVIEERR